MKIKRVVVRNYRGIEEREVQVPAAGVIAKGRNGSGKSSLLKAIKAALLGQDVSADAIRKGAEQAEILIDTDDVTVSRILHRDGKPELSVERGEIPQKKPATLLTSLLGTSSLDPMDLLLLKGKERRAAVLQALPVRVTVEQLRTWWPKCPDGYDCSGHGLEVVAGVRDAAYKKRTDLNRIAKETAAEAVRLQVELDRATGMVPVPCPDPAASQRELETATANLTTLQARAQQVEKQAKGTESQRAKVQELRARAVSVSLQVKEIDAAVHEGARNKVVAIEQEVERLREALQLAEQSLAFARQSVASLDAQQDKSNAFKAEAESLNHQADDLEAALAQAAVEPVTAEDLVHAREAVTAATAAHTKVQEAIAAHKRALDAAASFDKARAAADQAKADADRIDAVVQALTEDAPAQLLAACDGIQGLSLHGDEVLLDGVSLDGLCGAEQVKFCVEVARRANAKSKILVVDGLERIDPDALDVFVREATKDDYQLIATKVDRGDVVIESIQPDDERKAA